MEVEEYNNYQDEKNEKKVINIINEKYHNSIVILDTLKEVPCVKF